MRVMGIDQSYRKCGVVILDGIDFICLRCFGANEELDIFDQAMHIAEQVHEIIKDYRPDVVGLEGLAFSSQGNRTRDLGGLMFTLIHTLRHIGGYEERVIPPTTLKKFATGKGNNKKKMLYEALPDNVKNHFKVMGFTSIAKGREDVTDAYWIARYLQENE